MCCEGQNLDRLNRTQLKSSWAGHARIAEYLTIRGSRLDLEKTARNNPHSHRERMQEIARTFEQRFGTSLVIEYANEVVKGGNPKIDQLEEPYKNE